MTALLEATQLSKHFPLRREADWRPWRRRKQLFAVDGVDLSIGTN